MSEGVSKLSPERVEPGRSILAGVFLDRRKQVAEELAEGGQRGR